MLSVQLFGLLGGFLAWGAQVPQAIKIIKTRSTRDLSVRGTTMLTLGTLLLFLYGVGLGELPLIVCNGLGLLTSGFIMYRKTADYLAGSRSSIK